MDTRSRIALLGGLRIEQGNRAITRFRTQKTAALLAYLAYYCERSHPREHLIDLLWPEADLPSGRNSLSIALSSLRHQLEPPGVPHGAILRADRSSVQLNPEAVHTDVAEFEAALQQATQAGSANERILFLANGVELYGGELLPGFYEEWCLTERQRLVGAYLGALHQLVGALERTGDLDRALGYARRAVSADPLREEGYQHVMRLLAAAGQPTAALRQYRELEQVLDEQLGEAPAAITRQLALEIERQITGPPATTRQVEKATAPRRRRHSAVPARLPTGTVTFLLTDLEGSTAQWEKGGEGFTAALASHHTLLRREFRRFGGYEVQEAGDGFIVAFERAGDALTCAVAGQRALAEHPWPQEVGPLRVRMALHTGDVELQEGEYHGLVLHHASRVLAAGHGGQILCSEATAVVVQRRLEPGTRLTDLGVYRLRDVEHPERLFQLEYPEMAQSVFPPLRAEARYGRNLPLQFTRFIGRERELGQLEALLLAEQTRLVTLTGPGGTGKSRLALELAGRLVERFQGAVWLVSLADLLDPRRIVDALLDALRLPRSPSLEPLDQVVEMLSRQPSLLVLDNFEQLVEAGASVVQSLLERVPALQCLVTSRQILGLAGEREFVVPALQTPAGAPGAGQHGAPPAPLALEQLSMYESVQLFIDRAQVVKPDFQVTNQNAAAVAELCNRLEGSPLALELAAARSQVLTPGQMIHQLAHRFEFLVSRTRGGAKRHQTLHAAMEWSYRLLTPELQRFFARLSVFRGGWTLEAAEAVCEEPLALDYLAQLRECSLVLTEEDGVETRFRMLDTIREYGLERLMESGEAETTRQEHVHFLVALAERVEGELQGEARAVCLDRLEAEHDNLRAALNWCEGERGRAPSGPGAETGQRLAEALERIWISCLHLELSQEAPDEGVAEPNAIQAVPRAAALFAEYEDLGSVAGSDSRADESVEQPISNLAEEPLIIQIAHCIIAKAIYWRALAVYVGPNADNVAIQFRIDDVLHQFAALPKRVQAKLVSRYKVMAGMNVEEHSVAQDGRCGIAHRSQDWDVLVHSQPTPNGEAVTLRIIPMVPSEESLAVWRRLGDNRAVALSLARLGNVARSQGDYAAAGSRLTESLAVWQQLGDAWGLAVSLANLGRLAWDQSDYGDASALYAESLAIRRELGGEWGLIECLEGLALARVAGVYGQPDRAARLLGAAETLRSRFHVGPPEVSERDAASLHTALGDEAFAAAWAEGRALTLDQAVSYALEEPGADPPSK